MALGRVAAGADTYHINLADDGRHTCECKGFIRWQKPCKHISGLLALRQAGQL